MEADTYTRLRNRQWLVAAIYFLMTKDSIIFIKQQIQQVNAITTLKQNRCFLLTFRSDHFSFMHTFMI